MSTWQRTEEFKQADLQHGEWDGQPLTADQIATQCMYCQRFKQPEGNWLNVNRSPQAPVSHGICPDCWAVQPGMEKIPYPLGAAQGLPAEYSDDDPLDVAGMQQLVNDLHSEWWIGDANQQRQAIANGFRAALISPRMNLKWNSIVYQDLMHIPAEESDPNVFENVIRERKSKWDRFGQQTIDLVHENTQDPEFIDYGNRVVEKYMPGIWKNVRNCALVGPHVEDLRQAAMEDIAQGGDGRYFRRALLDLNIPGIGPKIAAFVWLLLAPKTSKLATVDVHMMRAMGQEADSPKDYAAYIRLEDQLDQQRQDQGYNDVPLGVYQWATWDRQRTPGYHQDHTPLRPLDPVDWRNVDWAPQPTRSRSKPPEVDAEQQPLFSNWKRRSHHPYIFASSDEPLAET